MRRSAGDGDAARRPRRGDSECCLPRTPSETEEGAGPSEWSLDQYWCPH